jgi:hypoxia up-regulated 1
VRDLVEDDSFTSFGSAPMIKDISKLVKSTSSWLSDNSDAKSEVLVEKLKSITDLVNPIKQRKEDATQLPEQTELLRSILDQSKTLIGVIRDTIEAASKSAASLAAEASKTAEEAASSASSAVVGDKSADPLAELEQDEPATSSSSSSKVAKPSVAPEPGYTEEELKSLNEAYEKVETWLEEALAKQEKLKPWEDAVVKPGELQKKGKELNDALTKILSKKLKSQQSRWGGSSKEDMKKAEKAAKEALAKARARAKQEGEKVKSKAAEATESVKSKADKIKDEL